VATEILTPTPSQNTPISTPALTPILIETPTPTPSPTPMPTPTPTPTPTLTLTPLTFEYGVKYKVKVLDVIDGYTIDVLLPDGSRERVRMLGVDTPEKNPEDNKPYEYDSITDLNYLAE